MVLVSPLRALINILTACAIIACLSAKAPTALAETETDIQAWTGIVAVKKLTDGERPLFFWLDLQGRRSQSNATFLVRPAIGWAPVPWLYLFAGYGLIPVNPDSGSTIYEHRPWQQLSLQTSTPGGVSVQARFRLEQRIMEGGDDIGIRMRQFLRGSYQPRADVPLGVVLWDEIFVTTNDTDWGQTSGFDQNRFFIGPMLPLHRSVRVEVGYLSIYESRDPANRINHVFMSNLFISI